MQGHYASQIGSHIVVSVVLDRGLTTATSIDRRLLILIHMHIAATSVCDTCASVQADSAARVGYNLLAILVRGDSCDRASPSDSAASWARPYHTAVFRLEC